MNTETILGIGALIVIVAFIVFAFRKGQSVKPGGRDPSQKDDYT